MFPSLLCLCMLAAGKMLSWIGNEPAFPMGLSQPPQGICEHPGLCHMWGTVGHWRAEQVGSAMGVCSGTGGTPLWGELQTPPLGRVVWLGRTWPGSDLPPMVSKGLDWPRPCGQGGHAQSSCHWRAGEPHSPRTAGAGAALGSPCRSRAGTPRGSRARPGVGAKHPEKHSR